MMLARALPRGWLRRRVEAQIRHSVGICWEGAECSLWTLYHTKSVEFPSFCGQYASRWKGCSGDSQAYDEGSIPFTRSTAIDDAFGRGLDALELAFALFHEGAAGLFCVL